MQNEKIKITIPARRCLQHGRWQAGKIKNVFSIYGFIPPQ